MRLRQFCLPLVILLLSTVDAAAQEPAEEKASNGITAEVALSNDTLQIRGIRDADRLGLSDGEIMAAFFLSEERDIVLSAGLLFGVDFNLGPVSVKLGPQAYAALLEDENSDVMTLSVGGEVRWVIIRDLDLALMGQAFYAPDILTFGSADNLTDLMARVEIRHCAAYARLRRHALVRVRPHRGTRHAHAAGRGLRGDGVSVLMLRT